MNSEEHQTISNPSSSEDKEPTDPTTETRNGENTDRTTKPRQQRSHLKQLRVTRREQSAFWATKNAPHRTTMTRSLTPNNEKPRDFITGIEYRTKFMREIKNSKNLDPTTKARIHRSSLFQVDVTRREKSASCTMECASRRATTTRSLTPSDEKPRDFITGIEYRTKFMRETSCDPGQKLRYSSGVINPQQTKADTRTVSRWRPNACLVKHRKRKEDAKKSTSEVGTSHPQNSANRTSSQLNKSAADVRMRHSRGHSDVQRKNAGRTKPPSDPKDTSETMKSGVRLTHQKSSRAATPCSDTTITEGTVNQFEDSKTGLKTSEISHFNRDFDQMNDSIEPIVSDKYLNGNEKTEFSNNLPNSPPSEPRGSNSLHTTPRSPRTIQKNSSNYSALHSEVLEVQRTSFPRATVNCCSKPPGPSKQKKFLPSSDIILPTKTWESMANESRTKSPTTKQEPITFTTNFVPLLRWTGKTSPGGLFEPHALEGSSGRSNSTARQDGGNASNDKSHENVLSNLPPKNTTNSNVNAVQNEYFLKQQQMAANEDCVLLDPSLTDIPGEGEKITKVTISKKKSMARDPTRSHTRDHHPAVKKLWKPTALQQVVSGCALRPDTISQMPKRPQSMKTIMMSKQSPPYARNAIHLLGDFARRPVSARIKGKIKETNMDKKPVWK